LSYDEYGFIDGTSSVDGIYAAGCAKHPCDVSRTTKDATGVFRMSRNPMYLGFALILFGIGVFLTTLTPYLVVFILPIFLDIVFVRVEEKKLEGTFCQA
jgi:hypothetical protein